MVLVHLVEQETLHLYHHLKEIMVEVLYAEILLTDQEEVEEGLLLGAMVQHQLLEMVVTVHQLQFQDHQQLMLAVEVEEHILALVVLVEQVVEVMEVVKAQELLEQLIQVEVEEELPDRVQVLLMVMTVAQAEKEL